MRTNKIDVPLPSAEQVEYYLRAWDMFYKRIILNRGETC